MGRRISLQLSPENPAGPPVMVTVTIGSEVKFSLQTSDLALAKLRHSEAVAQVTRHYQALLAGPKPLSVRSKPSCLPAQSIT
ncbi:MAG TPA: hypothetical protein VFV47_01295, partial [Hyphomicrobiaceae bacterium]|nr:hypothetical protein [Hyphomicrobiaceae bacterium]